jgi:hypothetical protein
VTIADRFAVALAGSNASDLAGPELLPVRLARACAQALEIDGAGISLLDAKAQRVPLGASDDLAELAERLQFTAGEGPCMTAQDTRQPVFAVEEDLRRRWPVFAGLLTESTPYRAVVALPLQPSLAGSGAIDLFFTDSDRVAQLDVFDAVAVGELVTSSLSDAAVWAPWSPGSGPAWMTGPVPQRRAAVWEALGTVSMDLDVPAREALALLRASAYAESRTVDDVAADMLAGRLHAKDLHRRDDGAA